MKFAGWGDPAKSFSLEGKPDLWPFIRRVSGVADRAPQPPVAFDSIALPEPRIDEAFFSAMKKQLRDDQIASDRTTRLFHCYGKSYRDLLRAIAGQVERAPDLVLFPESHEEVEAIVATAAASGVKLIAYGGGTNIVGGVEVTPATAGTVATVSLRRMKRVLKIDESSLVATMEAGLLGPELEAALNAAGYSLGHFPDSFEYSTLGGWLATRSAGMQSDRWGKIEDMVVSLTMVSPSGTLRTREVPKAATGPDLNQLVVGSEGILGLITEATMKIHPLEGREYRGLLVPDFASGVALIRRCLRDDCLPSTMRLSCPEETQLGIAMKPRPSPGKAILQGLGKAWLRAAKGIRMEKACAIIVGFEGDRKRIAAQRRRVLALTRERGGIDLGTSAGDRWYAGKYDYPYLRDALMVRGGMVDVTETSALWSEILPLYETMKRALHDHLRRGDHPGYVGCHLSHSYAAGACLYFTFASEREQGNELNQYLAAKRAAVEAIVASGAALSHHHAIGYEHLPWIEQALGEAGLRALRGLKDALDPGHLCNPGKLLPGPDSSLDHYWPDPALTKRPEGES